jgi:hypothetical protein
VVVGQGNPHFEQQISLPADTDFLFDSKGYQTADPDSLAIEGLTVQEETAPAGGHRTVLCVLDLAGGGDTTPTSTVKVTVVVEPVLAAQPVREVEVQGFERRTGELVYDSGPQRTTDLADHSGVLQLRLSAAADTDLLFAAIGYPILGTWGPIPPPLVRSPAFAAASGPVGTESAVTIVLGPDTADASAY